MTKEQKEALYNAGPDPVHIVNAFYNYPLGTSNDVFNDWWTLKVCILAERIAELEERLKKCQEK